MKNGEVCPYLEATLTSHFLSQTKTTPGKGIELTSFNVYNELGE